MQFKQDDIPFDREERPELKVNVLVVVDNIENVHHGKTGWVESIDQHALASIGVKFKDENGFATFRKSEVKVIGTFYREERSEMLKEDHYNPQATAVALVGSLFYPGLPVSQIYIVWYVTALQNWKALVSTNVADNCYYEVTHNGDKCETYVDRYTKEYNVKISYHESGKLADADVEFNKI